MSKIKEHLPGDLDNYKIGDLVIVTGSTVIAHSIKVGSIAKVTRVYDTRVDLEGRQRNGLIVKQTLDKCDIAPFPAPPKGPQTLEDIIDNEVERLKR